MSSLLIFMSISLGFFLSCSNMAVKGVGGGGVVVWDKDEVYTG